MEDPFLFWLNRDSREAFEDLRYCAKMVITRAEGRGIILDDSYLQNDDFNTYLDAVASALWSFLKENSDEISRQATSLLILGDINKFANFICNKFIDSCRDKRRTDTPFYAYYRHMVTVLRETDGVNLHSIPRKYSFYAWSNAKDLPFEPDNDDFRLTYMNYASWSSCSIPFRDIGKKESMVAISRHYWDEAIRMTETEYLFSIRGLTAFVDRKYPLTPKIEYESEAKVETEEGQKTQGIGETLINPDQQLPSIPPAIIEVDINRIARDCVARLTKEEKIVVSKYDNEMGGSLAKILGKSGGTITNRKHSALKKIREAWSLWGQPNSDYLDVEIAEYRIFVKNLVRICKESVACRDSGKRGNK